MIHIILVQGRHYKYVLKEFPLTHLKIKLSAYFFLYYMKMIYRRGKRKNNLVKPPPCLRDVLDSRTVVGPGERTLLPGHVREWGHHGGLQESEVFWWVLLMILSQAFKKILF